MQLTIGKHAGLGVAVHDGQEADASVLHLGGTPVARIGRNEQVVVEVVGIEHIGTVAHPVTHAAPEAAAVEHATVGLHRMRRHGAPGKMQQQMQQVRRGAGEAQLQGVGIGRMHAYLLPRGLSLVEGLGAGYRVEHLGILAAKLRVQQALVGVHKIMRGDGAAIAPLRRAQVEGPFGSIVIVLPALGHAGVDACIILRIGAHQPLQQGSDNLAIGHGGGLVRVEAEGLLVVAHDENPLLRGLFCRAARIATPRQQQGSKTHTDERQQFHAPHSTTAPRPRKRTVRQTHPKGKFCHLCRKIRKHYVFLTGKARFVRLY